MVTYDPEEGYRFHKSVKTVKPWRLEANLYTFLNKGSLAAFDDKVNNTKR